MLLVVLWMPPLNLSDLFFLELNHVLSRLVDTVELVGLCLVFLIGYSLLDSCNLLGSLLQLRVWVWFLRILRVLKQLCDFVFSLHDLG